MSYLVTKWCLCDNWVSVYLYMMCVICIVHRVCGLWNRMDLHLNTGKSCPMANEVIIHYIYVIWYDVVWCDVMWCVIVMWWDGMGWDMIWFGMAWFDFILILFDSIRFDLIWFDLIQYKFQELEYRKYCKVCDISLHLNTGKCCPISCEGSVFYKCMYVCIYIYTYIYIYIDLLKC